MNEPFAMIIGGHPRSGTSLLYDICFSHPDILITYEFRSYIGLGRWPRKYLQLLKPYNTRKPLLGRRKQKTLPDKISCMAFDSQYRNEFRKIRARRIKPQDILDTYRKLLPSAKVYGDKYPRYVFKLQKLSKIDHLRRVIIYRDPRDVIQSTLRRVNTDWKEKKFAENFNTAEKAAHHWVNAIEMMEKYSDTIHVVQYEQLVRQPETVITDLAKYLGVDPAGFDLSTIRDTSIGLYQTGLSPKQIRQIEEIAGPAMQRLGYL